SYTCEDMKLLNLDPSETTLICENGGKPVLNEVKTNDALVTINTEGFSNVGDTRQVSCTKPANSVYNTLEQITQTYDGENWLPTNAGVYSEIGSSTECKFKCGDGYNYELGACNISNTLNTITIGANRGCGLDYQGKLFCWGNNVDGHVGDGTVINRINLTHIDTDNTYKYVEANYQHTCGIRNDDKVYCWGRGYYGRLGEGSTLSSVHIKSPKPITSNESFVKISLGTAFTCGITNNGKLYCWGGNTKGQIGDGTTNTRTTPVEIDPSNNYKDISLGSDFACAIREDNKLYCWGGYSYLLIGDGSFVDKKVPTVVQTSLTFREISSGGHHFCGITNDGKLYCWGNGANGVLGNGSNTDILSPFLVDTVNSYISLSTSVYHTCGVTTDGKLYCWGENDSGQIGNGTTNNQYSPVQIDSSNKYKSIFAGYRHSTCGKRLDNSIYCWGENEDWQLGDGTNINRLTPFPIQGF
ncbi:MAG: hypothetical protein V3575_00740, partial [Candidatus Absconditabacteria bacterium]